MKITKRIASILICIMLVLSCVPMTAQASVCTGKLMDTDNDGYYEIGNVDDLYEFASLVNNGNTSINAILTDDITVNEDIIDGYSENIREWTAIGYSKNYKYVGKFNGNNKTISGLYIEHYKANNGLFGNVGDGAEIKNVTVKNSYFKAHYFAGGIAGIVANDTIENCSAVDVSINVDNSTAGGIVGLALESTVKNCFATGKVSAESNFGNIVGYTEDSTFENCFYPDTDSVGSDIGEAKTTEQFASGEVAYILGDEWGQKIGTDKYPVLGSDKVYYGYENCTSTEKIYGNSVLCDEIIHNYENGICTVCGAYEPAVDSDNDSYYEIDNAGKLYWFAQQVNSGNTTINAILTNDITLNEGIIDENTESAREWTPIGDYDYQYKGTFDGNSKTISGLYCNNTQGNNIGLFSFTAKNSVVKNVTITNSYFNADYCVGSIVALNYGKIENCHSDAFINVDFLLGGAGGIASNNYGTIEYSHNTGTLCGEASLAGIAQNNYGIISKCYNSGLIKGNRDIGGIAEYNKGTVEFCYNIGKLCGNCDIGGIADINDDGIIINCYNIGELTYNSGYNDIYNYNCGDIMNCYYLTESKDRYTEPAYFWNNVVGKSEEKFTNGEVAHLLCQPFGQKIGTDKYPVIDGDRVYRGYNSTDCCEKIIYSNTELTVTSKDRHEPVNGFCTICGEAMPAEDSDKDGIYEISNAGNLYWFAEQVNSGKTKMRAILTKNITINQSDVNKYSNYARVWTPIGNEENKYNGYFYGNGKTISGLYCNDSSQDYVGLFGCTDSEARIEKVNITNSYFCGNNYVGSLIGACYSTSCTFLYYSSNKGDVVGNNYVGGLVGVNYSCSGNIDECCNTGNVKGNKYVGGLCGSFENHSYEGNLRVCNCFNTGTIIGREYVGGLSGYIRNKGFQHCYNVGTIISNGKHVGGLIGIKVWDDPYCSDTPLTRNCYYLNSSYKKQDPNGEAKTALQFASGEVAYLLNINQPTDYWGQTIGTDKIPTLYGEAVYCIGVDYLLIDKIFSNSPLYGDVDLDGRITINDATLLAKYIDDETSLKNIQVYVADINHDGKINYDDVTCIQQKVSK